ncbi:MAG TPA: nucleotidyltransferase family protein, partial [Ktedonobacteraceae bacterium]|nr:nucleotidyltransferase family protein [Ktedonobacteraceae bacterium]
HKLLLPLEGRPVLAHVIDATLASQAYPIVIVLGHQAGHVHAQLTAYTASPEIIIVENPDYLQGMSTSMRVGIQEIISYGYRKDEQHANIDSVLILLGDQPLITQQGIDALITAWHTSGKRIMAPLYAGKRGNPLIFDASLVPELMAVTGDEGGRSVVERHKQDLATIELGDVIANYDVDTWEAYQQVVETWQHKKATNTE